MVGLETTQQDTSPAAFFVECILVAVYQNRPLPSKPASSLIPEKQSRNLEIVQRFLSGERAADLAQEFGISVVRVNRLVRRYEGREQKKP